MLSSSLHSPSGGLLADDFVSESTVFGGVVAFLLLSSCDVSVNCEVFLLFAAKSQRYQFVLFNEFIHSLLKVLQ